MKDEADDWATLASQMPFDLPGHGTISKLKINCPNCHQEIDPATVKARIRVFPDSVASFNILANCPKCTTPANAQFRIRAIERSFQIETVTNNQTQVWKGSRPILGQVFHLFSRMLAWFN